MKIDFQSKKTEQGWQETIDYFWLKVTPKWFDWLEWIFIIGALNFIAKKTNNFFIELIYAASYLALFFYLQSFFYSIKFIKIPFFKSESTQRATSLLISAILSLLIWLLVNNIVPEIGISNNN